MMQSMKGATMLLGSMNRQMNLPALQRIAMEFERENDIMDQRQEMMDDAIDEVTGLEDEEEGEEIVKEVLDEIGVDLSQAVRLSLSSKRQHAIYTNTAGSSWERPPQGCRRMRSAKGESPKQLAVAEVRTMMTCRQDSTVYDDDSGAFSFHERSLYAFLFVIGCLGVDSGRFGCMIWRTRGRLIPT